MSNFFPFVIVVVGPTASRKSELSVKLAKKLNGEVISADSRQVYKGLDIGSGKITKKEMRGVKHHLLDVVSPRSVFTVARYQKLATKALRGIMRRGKVPIICGGTGLYVRALVDQMSIPHVKPNFSLRKKLQSFSTQELFTLLKRKDSRRASVIDSHNPRRLIRALEIIDSFQKVPDYSTKPLPYPALFLGMKISRRENRRRIHKRLISRLHQGMIEEVQKLHKKGVSWKRLESLGLEYRYVSLYLQKKCSYEEMVRELVKEIVRYAKRQMTWFMRDKRIKWVEVGNQRKVLDLVKRFTSR